MHSYCCHVWLFYDFFFRWPLTIIQNTLVVQHLDLQAYMLLYVPAVDWIMQCIAYNASEVCLCVFMCMYTFTCMWHALFAIAHYVCSVCVSVLICDSPSVLICDSPNFYSILSMVLLISIPFCLCFSWFLFHSVYGSPDFYSILICDSPTFHSSNSLRRCWSWWRAQSAPPSSMLSSTTSSLTSSLPGPWGSLRWWRIVRRWECQSTSCSLHYSESLYC